MDLLCIVQDDRSNKHSVIAAMGTIFLQAALIITVLSGKNANSGIFVTEPESFRQGQKITDDLTVVLVNPYNSSRDRRNWFHHERAWT